MRRRYTPKQEAAFKKVFIERQRYQVAAFVPLVGAVLTLPGLPEDPGAADYDVDVETGAIVLRDA